ncbi:MAG: stage III sporulation protein AC [Oscillospiraceae bacterium]|nr:stage III sporulation protein AC [Oscillospiraceae bacterium]MBR2080256.1 stage III sporulation protein AC [Oscillospiraceae bacterium]MBR2366839.1 stage III sporulation protein AC [Oscillospiraceae bacterium]MBR2896558.1 stage III sporulation protein AC [Oscillospiraceae bacterium]MBR2976774.1 stage III sporulation protein AC [Oscillospiraceae bacterium]
MEIDLVFRIAAVGIIVAILDQVLRRTGREDIALVTTLAGLAVVLLIVAREISDLFSTVKTLFGF